VCVCVCACLSVSYDCCVCCSALLCSFEFVSIAGRCTKIAALGTLLLSDQSTDCPTHPITVTFPYCTNSMHCLPHLYHRYTLCHPLNLKLFPPLYSTPLHSTPLHSTPLLMPLILLLPALLCLSFRSLPHDIPPRCTSSGSMKW
jgi:hypothetical protein